MGNFLGIVMRTLELRGRRYIKTYAMDIIRQGNLSENSGEIVVYQPDEITRLEVRLDAETVWLTQAQIAHLFGVRQPAISKHLRNIFASGELSSDSVYSILEYTASDSKSYKTGFYNLDAILSVGYRVNSRNATLFRQWANKVLKDFLLRGAALQQQFHALEDRIDRRMIQYDKRLDAQEKKIDFFIQSNLPPKQGIFFDGQIYDAYTFVADLVRKAQRRYTLSVPPSRTSARSGSGSR